MVTHDPLAASHASHVVHLDKGMLGAIEANPERLATAAGS